MKITQVLVIALMLSCTAKGAVYNVPGTSNPWLAGMPGGTTTPGGDIVPAHSPVELGVVSGQLYFFSVAGGVSNDPSYPVQPPDGDLLTIIAQEEGPLNNIAIVTAPLNCLLGVFLGPGQPNLGVTPSALDFTSPASRDYLILSPALQQPFFIGDGLTSLGAIQQVVAPTGATRLFLGAMDGSGWYNNVGSFTVTVVPEPGTGALTLIAIAGACLFRRIRR